MPSNISIKLEVQIVAAEASGQGCCLCCDPIWLEAFEVQMKLGRELLSLDCPVFICRSCRDAYDWGRLSE